MSGSFTLDASLWKTFDRIAIGLVVGGGGDGPKWAVFELPEGEASGMWAQELEHGGGLGHAVLYGKDALRASRKFPSLRRCFC